MFDFSIPQWQAWAPGIDNAAAWQAWAGKPYSPAAGGPLPNLAFLPPLQRRRLSPLARMALGCAWPLAQDQPAMPVVYASQHGETTRGFELLQCLARDEPLSPTSFSLSVHNAIAGMWSILRKETAESVALSVEGDGLESAIAEACLLLRAGHQQVMVVLAEETPPQPYTPWIDDVPFAYALALVIARGNQFHLHCAAPPGNATDEQAPGQPALPHPLSLLRHLALQTPAWRHSHRRRQWHWRRAS